MYYCFHTVYFVPYCLLPFSDMMYKYSTLKPRVHVTKDDAVVHEFQEKNHFHLIRPNLKINVV